MTEPGLQVSLRVIAGRNICLPVSEKMQITFCISRIAFADKTGGCMEIEQKQGQDQADKLYEEFLDSRYIREKREILRRLYAKEWLTDKMIDDFAVTLDIAVSSGSLDDRYYDFMKCLDSMARFETTGLR